MFMHHASSKNGNQHRTNARWYQYPEYMYNVWAPELE